MTISDVLVAAPWIVFAAALAVICIPLLSSRRAWGLWRRQARPSPEASDGPPVRTGPQPTPQQSRKRMRRLKPFAVVPAQRVWRSCNGQDTGRKAESADVGDR